jgi:hypothetical protein
MTGVAPRFYKLPITAVLVTAVAESQYPQHTTVVECLIPPVLNEQDFLRVGMVPLDNRRVCSRCFEALRHLLLTML